MVGSSVQTLNPEYPLYSPYTGPFARAKKETLSPTVTAPFIRPFELEVPSPKREHIYIYIYVYIFIYTEGLYREYVGIMEMEATI